MPLRPARLPLFLVALTTLAACLSDAPNTNPDDLCNAARFDGQIGAAIDDLGLTPSRELRIIRPGDAVTMDYNPQRLNIELDSNDRLTRAYCS